MGRWSRHPMGSDGALDAEDDFFREIYLKFEREEKEEDYYEEEGYNARLKFLQEISLEDLKTLGEEKYLSENRYTIPYIFLQYKINRPELKEYLVECFDHHDDITGPWNYCSELTEDGEVIELAHIRVFKENFDDIMSGKAELPDDEGLFAAIFKHDGSGLINKL